MTNTETQLDAILDEVRATADRYGLVSTGDPNRYALTSGDAFIYVTIEKVRVYGVRVTVGLSGVRGREFVDHRNVEAALETAVGTGIDVATHVLDWVDESVTTAARLMWRKG